MSGDVMSAAAVEIAEARRAGDLDRVRPDPAEYADLEPGWYPR